MPTVLVVDDEQLIRSSLSERLSAEGCTIREALTRALKRTGWNHNKAAPLLGLNRDQIRYRIDKFGLEKAAERE